MRSRLPFLPTAKSKDIALIYWTSPKVVIAALLLLVMLSAAHGLAQASTTLGDITAQAETTPEATADLLTASIVGRVTSGTAGGAVPPSLPLTLYALEETNAGINQNSFTSATDDNGNFVFVDVPLDPAHSYIASTVYRERLFTSDLTTGAALAADPRIALTIYELTEDPTVVQIQSMDMQVEAVSDGLQFLQEVVFTNTSDRLYTNQLQVEENVYASVVIGLPPGAVGLAFPGNPERFVPAEDQGVVVDTIPVVPGEQHRVQMSYFMPYEDGAVIEQPVYYDFNGSVRLLVWPASLRLTSELLVPGAPETVNDRVYQAYTGTVALQPGDVVRFDLAGQATGGSAGTASVTPTLLIVIILVQIAVVGGVLYLFLKRRARPAPAPRKQALVDGLIRQIAELDNQHDAGRIDDATYQTQRGQLKARLAQLMEEK